MTNRTDDPKTSCANDAYEIGIMVIIWNKMRQKHEWPYKSF